MYKRAAELGISQELFEKIAAGPSPTWTSGSPLDQKIQVGIENTGKKLLGGLGSFFGAAPTAPATYGNQHSGSETGPGANGLGQSVGTPTPSAVVDPALRSGVQGQQLLGAGQPPKQDNSFGPWMQRNNPGAVTAFNHRQLNLTPASGTPQNPIVPAAPATMDAGGSYR
jgi:hypothetical protein